MTFASPKEGPRAPLFYGAAFLLWSGLLQAQSVPLSVLEACAGLETADLRLACFEALVNAEREKIVAEVPSAVPADDVTAAAVEPELAPVESVPAVAPMVSPAPAGNAADSFGSEHLGNNESASLEARVTEVTRDRYGALIFHLDNGQLWQQMEPRYYPYPRNGEFDVLITTGMMGEYRLQVGGSGRKVNIRRIR
ncbi:MAG: hypothetical protein OEM63_13890 [Gammaproteobacteria bacterium]|nr:hypothetical protein [Gammaproteobacteria bacterium]